MEERIITGSEQDGDNWQYSLRPRLLNEYIGQDQVKNNLAQELVQQRRQEAINALLKDTKVVKGN